METLQDKIEAAKKELHRDKGEKKQKRNGVGEYRRKTWKEKFGWFPIIWIFAWGAAGGWGFTYAWDHRNELIGTRTVVITPAEAKTTNDAPKEVKAPENSKSEAKEGEFTAYNAEEAQTDADPYTMASGKRVYEGAVANNCLPFGTKIKVNGKIKVVDDRMKAGTDCDHFDIFMESHEDAINFGRKKINYEIL